MRKTKVPPVCRAYAQLNKHVRTIPTWGVPVGEDGAAAIYALGDLATVQMSNPGHRGYIIFDGKYEDYLAGFMALSCMFAIAKAFFTWAKARINSGASLIVSPEI